MQQRRGGGPRLGSRPDDEVRGRRQAVQLLEDDGAQVILKLAESPFYATGGGQVADAGFIECEDGDCRARLSPASRGAAAP